MLLSTVLSFRKKQHKPGNVKFERHMLIIWKMQKGTKYFTLYHVGGGIIVWMVSG